MSGPLTSSRCHAASEAFREELRRFQFERSWGEANTSCPFRSELRAAKIAATIAPDAWESEEVKGDEGPAITQADCHASSASASTTATPTASLGRWTRTLDEPEQAEEPEVPAAMPPALPPRLAAIAAFADLAGHLTTLSQELSVPPSCTRPNSAELQASSFDEMALLRAELQRQTARAEKAEEELREARAARNVERNALRQPARTLVNTGSKLWRLLLTQRVLTDKGGNQYDTGPLYALPRKSAKEDLVAKMFQEMSAALQDIEGYGTSVRGEDELKRKVGER